MSRLYKFFRQLPIWLQTIASLITVGGFVYLTFGVIIPNNDASNSRPGVTYPPSVVTEPFAVPAASPVLVEPGSTVTPAPTATPTPIPPLDEQLERALTIPGSTARGEGLAVVASQAILLGDYWTAIRAAAATPGSTKQASNLELVVKCAIEDEQFSMAAEAASRVGGYTSRGRLMIMALEAQESAIKREVLPPPLFTDQSSQPRLMVCLGTGKD